MLYQLLLMLYRLDIACGVFDWRVKYEERIPATGGAILAANHCGSDDPPFIALATPRMVRFMARSKPRIAMRAYRLLGAFPVNKGTPDIGAIRTAIRLLDTGDLVGMMVIGHNDRDKPDPLPQRGACAIARRCKQGVLLVPVGVYRYQRYTWQKEIVAVVIGPPIKPWYYANEYQMNEELGRRIAQARREAEVYAKEPRPRS